MKRFSKYFLFLLLSFFWHNGLFAQKMKQAIDSLLTVMSTSKEDTNKVKILNDLSWRLRIVSEYEKAKQCANSALQLAEKLNFKQGKAAAYNVIGVINMDKGNYPEALKYFNDALKINEGIRNKQATAACYGNIGIIYMAQGNYPEALKYHRASLKINEENNNKIGASACFNNIGSVYKMQGNYPEALKNQFACLKNAEEIGIKGYIAVAYQDISEIYEIQGNYPGALKNLFDALKIQGELGDKRSIVGLYNNIGNIYFKQNNYPDAIKTYLAALTIGEEIGDKRGIAISLSRLGNIYNKQDNYPDALKKYLASLKLFEEIGDKEWVARVYIDIGKILSKQAADNNSSASGLKNAQSIEYLNKGLLLAKEIGANETVKDAFGGLAVVYKGMNDYKKALEYNSLYAEMKDSLLNNETTRKLEQLRTQYEVEKALEQEKIMQEKALAEKNVKHELELAEEKVKKEKAIEIEKLKYEFALAEERTEQKRVLAEQNFLNEKNLAEENARHQQALVEQKALQEKKEAAEKVKQEKKEAALIAQQEKQKAEQKRKTELLMLGAGMLIVILVLGSLYLRQKTLKQKAMERVDAVHKMAELELQSLRAQLNPHFMFNSLNAIQDLILKEDNRSSHRYLSRFSKLLRMLLDNANQPFIPLRKELDFLELYLSLENLRIPDLHYSIKTEPGIDAETTLIPNMMMQPYIENAIWHGLSHKSSDKRLDINIHRVNGSLQCDIEDNGVGRKKAEELKSLYRKEHRSKGMELLSKRFTLLSKEYGTDIQTRVTDLVNNGLASGTRVEITVPISFTKKTKAILYDTNHYH